MEIFIATLSVFLIAFFSLSVGMIFSDIKLKGHCGSPSLNGGHNGTSQHGGGKDGGEGCSIDDFGNKINICPTCDCES